MRIILAILVLALCVGATAVGLIAVLAGWRRRSLASGAPMGALVEPKDSTATVQYKRRVYAQQRKHVRLLEEVRRVDETMTFLPATLRKEIDEAVEEFYGEG